MSATDPNHTDPNLTDSAAGDPYVSSGGMEAVRGTAILCFAAVIAGDIFLLRKVLSYVLISQHQLPFILEAASWAVLLVGIIWIWTHKKGWGTVKSKVIVFSLFGLYVLYSVLFYSDFQTAYMTSFSEPAVAGAMVGVKLVLVLIGLTAGIPTGPKIDSHEYAHRLREKALQQEAEWAKESVRGARKDLQATVEKLKNTLTPEELQALMEELQQGVSADGHGKVPSNLSPDAAVSPAADGTSAGPDTTGTVSDTTARRTVKAADLTDTEAIGMDTDDVRGGWGAGV